MVGTEASKVDTEAIVVPSLVLQGSFHEKDGPEARYVFMYQMLKVFKNMKQVFGQEYMFIKAVPEPSECFGLIFLQKQSPDSEKNAALLELDVLTFLMGKGFLLQRHKFVRHEPEPTVQYTNLIARRNRKDMDWGIAAIPDVSNLKPEDFYKIPPLHIQRALDLSKATRIHDDRAEFIGRLPSVYTYKEFA